MILTKNDFYRFAPVDLSYDWSVAKDYVEDVEDWLFDMTISLLSLKTTLTNDLNNNYNVDLFPYNPRKQYSQNEVVFYNENIYKWTLESDSNAEPGTIGWVIVNKFNTESNNVLWNKIGKLLSLKLLLSTISFTTMRAGAKGLVVHTEDSSNMRGANRTELIEYKRELQANIDFLLGSVLKAITKNDSCGTNKGIDTSPFRRKIMM